MKTNPKLPDMMPQPNVRYKGDSLLLSEHANVKVTLIFFSLSIFFHGLFFAGLIYMQDFRLPKTLPPVIQIDLVSFAPQPILNDSPPPAEEKAKPEEGFVSKPEIKEKKPPKIESKKPDISLKTKPKNLKKLIEKKKQEKKDPVKKKAKKETPKPKKTKTVEKPLKDIETKPEDTAVDPDQQRIAEALRRLEDKLREQGKTRDSGSEGSRTGYGRPGTRPIDIYNVVIGSTIEQNWVFNEILAKMDQDLEVRILIKILKSGEIRDIIYETKSGNRYLDESAKKAIKKANPLPALPPGIHSYDVGLIFTPRGLK